MSGDFVKDEIAENILCLIEKSDLKITPSELEKRASAQFNVKRKNIKSVIKSLVEKGDLAYTYIFGRTFIEKSFYKPVYLSKHVIITPPGVLFSSKEKDDVVIKIKDGASFGTGRHPSTLLSVKGIEYLLKDSCLIKKNNNACLLDIGTGSGILLITAIMLGIKRGVGIDIDPCSLYDASENIKENDLEDRAKIFGISIDDIKDKFQLITANLRYPTLKKLFPKINEITAKNGAVVVSGLKTYEAGRLINIYTEKYFKLEWNLNEKDWAGLVFVKQ